MKRYLAIIPLMLTLLACDKNNESTSFLQQKAKRENLPLLSGEEFSAKSILETFIIKGKLKEVAMIILSKKVDVNELASTGDSYPLFALKHGQLLIAQFFLKEGNNGDFYNNQNELITIPTYVLDKYLGDFKVNGQDQIVADLEVFGFFARLGSNLIDPVFSRTKGLSEIILKFAIQADINLAAKGYYSSFTKILVESNLKIDNYQDIQTNFSLELKNSAQVLNKIIKNFAEIPNFQALKDGNIIDETTSEKDVTPQFGTFYHLLKSLDQAGVDFDGSNNDISPLAQMMYTLDTEVFKVIYYLLKDKVTFSIYRYRDDNEKSSTLIEKFITNQDKVCTIITLNTDRNNTDCFNAFLGNLGAYIILLDKDYSSENVELKIRELLNFMPDQGHALDLFASGDKISPQIFTLMIALGADLRDWLQADTDLNRREKRKILKAIGDVDDKLKLLIRDQKRKPHKRHFKSLIELIKVISENNKPGQAPIYLDMQDIL
jgi:hypothetical protein